MRYEKAEDLNDGDFKRFCRVKKETFLKMCQVVQKIEDDKTSGREAALSVEDQVLLTRALLA